MIYRLSGEIWSKVRMRRRGDAAEPSDRVRAGRARACAGGTAGILAVLATIAVSLWLAPVGAAVVGGTETTIEQVPWQVALFEKGEGKKLSFLCGGSIHDPTHVVTAAHCLFDSEGTEIPESKLVVIAGVSTTPGEEIESAAAGQQRLVTKAIPHPYYERALGAGSPDDVAVLQLAAPPLAPSSAVSELQLPNSMSAPSEGTQVSLSGFGEQKPGARDGKLYSLQMALGFSRSCAVATTGTEAEAATREASALFLCGSSGEGSACEGDSGGAVTDAGSPGTLIGVIDTTQVVAETHCQPAALNGFVNVAAPEISDFIEHPEERPPRAPRGGGVEIHGVVNPGHSLTCDPGSWINGPTFTYSFLDSASRQILQQGVSSTYALTTADLGRRILCQVQATNEGGTGVARTSALPPVEPAPAASSATSTSGPTPAGRVLSATEAGVSRAQIAALLRRQLKPRARAAKIASVLRKRGLTIRLTALEPGTVSVAWYASSSGAGKAKQAKAKSRLTLLAAGHKRFPTAKTTTLKLTLTRAGRRLLGKASSVKLTAKGSFTPKGKRPIRVTRKFVLK